MIIMGIDPGLAAIGYGVIKKQKQNLRLIRAGCITTPSSLMVPDRLRIIYKQLKKIIQKNKPSILAVEELFFCKNTKTALQVGQARGVILLTAIQENCSIQEFTPLQVKQAITGYGRAEKQQIQKMIKILLDLKTAPRSDDAADALAIAVCCAQSLRMLKNYQNR